jgi:hypothetical protein
MYIRRFHHRTTIKYIQVHGVFYFLQITQTKKWLSRCNCEDFNCPIPKCTIMFNVCISDLYFFIRCLLDNDLQKTEKMTNNHIHSIVQNKAENDRRN